MKSSDAWVTFISMLNLMFPAFFNGRLRLTVRPTVDEKDRACQEKVKAIMRMLKGEATIKMALKIISHM